MLSVAELKEWWQKKLTISSETPFPKIKAGAYTMDCYCFDILTLTIYTSLDHVKLICTFPIPDDLDAQIEAVVAKVRLRLKGYIPRI